MCYVSSEECRMGDSCLCVESGRYKSPSRLWHVSWGKRMCDEEPRVLFIYSRSRWSNLYCDHRAAVEEAEKSAGKEKSFRRKLNKDGWWHETLTVSNNSHKNKAFISWIIWWKNGLTSIILHVWDASAAAGLWAFSHQKVVWRHALREIFHLLPSTCFRSTLCHSQSSICSADISFLVFA